jgi:hypothetical protein
MTSRSVGSDHDRRLRVLRDLTSLPFHAYVLAVDKRRITSEGLRYKGSFYKYLYGLLYSRLYRVFPDLRISNDQIEGRKFMEEFEAYVRRRHIPDLFNQSSFRFAHSGSTLLLQLADFIGGSVARAYKREAASERAAELMKALGRHIIDVEEWPRIPWERERHSRREPGRGYDQTIAALSENLAQVFVDENERKATPRVRDQVHFLRFLLFYFRHIDSRAYVSTREIMRNLNEGQGRTLTEHYFRTRVVAMLRDQGLLIASSPKGKGLKLPASEQDLNDFVRSSSTVIEPMLSRVRRCRDQVRLATRNGIDILDQPDFGYLREFFDRRTAVVPPS